MPAKFVNISRTGWEMVGIPRKRWHERGVIGARAGYDGPRDALPDRTRWSAGLGRDVATAGRRGCYARAAIV